jgi:hypothetical protein
VEANRDGVVDDAVVVDDDDRMVEVRVEDDLDRLLLDVGLVDEDEGVNTLLLPLLPLLFRRRNSPFIGKCLFIWFIR